MTNQARRRSDAQSQNEFGRDIGDKLSQFARMMKLVKAVH
jgi:hypothetical protein